MKNRSMMLNYFALAHFTLALESNLKKVEAPKVFSQELPDKIKEAEERTKSWSRGEYAFFRDYRNS